MEKATEFKNLGNKAFTEKRFDEAINYFTQAIECNPNDHVFYSNRSGAYASLERYEEALNDAQKCVDINPNWAKGFLRKGLAEFYLEKYDQAIDTYNKGIALDPANKQLQEGLERAKEEKEFLELGNNAKHNLPGGMGQGMDNSFIKGLLGKLQTNPKTKEYLKDPDFMAKLQMMSQNPQLFGTLSQSDPRIQEALQVMLGGMDLGGMAGGMGGGMGAKQGGGKGEQEEKMEEEQYQQKPQSSKQPEPPKSQPQKSKQPLSEHEKLKEQGNELYKQKKFKEAIEMYDKAIELCPEELLYYTNKAAVFIEINELDNALECCNKALEIKEDNMIFDFIKLAKLYGRLGSIYEKKNDLDNAILYYNKSLLEDNNKLINEGLKRCLKQKKIKEENEYVNPELAEEANARGNDLFKAGKFPLAKIEYDEAVKRNPKGAKYFCNRAICYQKLMEWPTALKDLEKCIEIDPNYVKAYGKKGDCHFMMKEFHKAQPAYEKGLQIDPNNNDCKIGLQKTQSAIYMGSGSKEDQDARATQAMKDPEIQQIMMTPEIQGALKAMQENPKEAYKVLSNPVLAPKIQKLIAAGILKLG